MKLDDIRRSIDETDDELLALFLRRMALSEQVAKCKLESGLPLENKEREKQILDHVSRKAGENGQYARRLFSVLFELSKEKQSQLMAKER